MFITAILHCFLPRVKSLNSFFIIAFVCGFGYGNINAVTTTWLMEIWSGKHLAPILQAHQLMYGIGAILAPLLVRSFVSGHGKTHIDLDTRRHLLSIPFLISGLFCLIVPVMLLYAYLCFRYNQDKSGKSQGSDQVIRSQKLLDLSQHRKLRIPFHSIMLLLFLAYNLAEVGFSSFQNAYYQEFGIEAAKSADLGAIMATAFTVGRSINIITTQFISTSFILFMHFILAIFGFISLYLIQNFGQMNYYLLSCDSIIIGFAESAIVPALFALIDIYTTVDDRHNSMYFSSIGLPMIFAPILIGHHIKTMPNIVLHMSLFPVIFALILYSLITISLRIIQK
ncbi:Sodium-dependent glucose transporter-like protein 2 [Sarcoptes scabiei]|nr:Sodium-dependent glucose transporter-like protein 2 [Sarcoptes scabiei]